MTYRNDLKHISLPASLNRESFRPVTGFNPNHIPLTARQQRYLHAAKLENEINVAIVKRIELIQAITGLDSSIPVDGICLDLEGSDGNELAIDAFEDRSTPSAPIELLNVRRIDGKLHATIFVPQKKLERFKKKVKKYGDESQDPNGTKNSTIAIDSVEAVTLSELRSFWMEDTEFPSVTSQIATWEVWLRKGQAEDLRANASRLGIAVSEHNLKFHECEICLLTASLDMLGILQILSSPLAGFRYREEAPLFFTNMAPAEQSTWLNDLASRIQLPSEDAPAVCILDTGVHQPHTILSAALHEDHCDAYQPAWGKEDHNGHGTEMAGIALLGDLVPHLASNEAINLKHRLESVKILPPRGENPEELYGWITQECVARAQVNAPMRKRVFCLAITNPGQNTNGRPTAWSAALDKISMGVDISSNINDDKKQLFLVSVGNIRDALVHGQYSERNDVEPVENPAQAWNVLSVGAYTKKAFSQDLGLHGWYIVAQPGDICPTSRTSVSWQEKDWPIKPDVVFEGGNHVTDGSIVSDDSDLSLLTTGHNLPLKYTNETSPATAQASHLAAQLQAEYPDYWPETIRGLIVHSASWHNSMYRGLRPSGAPEKENLLRRFGYGVPDFKAACFSASNRACLISQHFIQPFSRPQGAASASYMDINYHTLPWPVDFLNEYGSTKMKIRVTLSYFIEPNPSDRLPTQKYSYASHRLKFSLQRPLETIDQFRARVNKKTRGEDYEDVGGDNWFLGPQSRNKGSVVSDVWTANASELAAQNTIAIMPEGGWWKYRQHLERGNQIARYALIVTLETDDQELDIYTRIMNEISVPAEITSF